MLTQCLAPEPSLGWRIAEIVVLLVAAVEIVVTLVYVAPSIVLETMLCVREALTSKPATQAPEAVGMTAGRDKARGSVALHEALQNQ